MERSHRKNLQRGAQYAKVVIKLDKIAGSMSDPDGRETVEEANHLFQSLHQLTAGCKLTTCAFEEKFDDLKRSMRLAPKQGVHGQFFESMEEPMKLPFNP